MFIVFLRENELHPEKEISRHAAVEDAQIAALNYCRHIPTVKFVIREYADRFTLSKEPTQFVRRWFPIRDKGLLYGNSD